MQNVIETEVLVIGAGPCGLFQVFQLGLQGIACHVVEALPHPGGQCAELYAEKPIYDIPGIPHILAAELTSQLMQQIKPFDPVIHYQQTVIEVCPSEEQGYTATTDSGSIFKAKNIVLAAGAGAFSFVKMRVSGIEIFEKRQLFYQSLPEQLINIDGWKKKHFIVTGDTTDAIQTAINLGAAGAHTTYIHRKRRFTASAPLLEELHQLADDNKITLLNGKITGVISNTVGDNITGLTIVDQQKEAREIDTDFIIACLGSAPKLNNFNDWNLQTNRHNVEVKPDNFESNLPGFYVIGDINTYPGKRKLILCGFHEATLAAFDIASKLNLDKPVHTLYTTTSTDLQKRLGLTQ